MSDVTAFLLARLADDEAAALAATPGPWWYDPTKVNSVDRGEAVFAGERGLSAITVCSTGPADDIPSMADGLHVARHDPARVLAQVAALRAVVEAVWELESFDYPDSATDAQVARKQNEILLALCQPYADHPNFDPAWLAS